MKLLLGANKSISKRIPKDLLQELINDDCNALQCFRDRSICSAATSRRGCKDSDVALGKIMTKNDIISFIHAPYTINLCNDLDQQSHCGGIEIAKNNMDGSVGMGCEGVIIHMGKNVQKRDSEVAKNNFVHGVTKILKETDKNSVLILENGAGVGSEVSTSLPELSQIRKSLEKKHRKRVKFCIDTCHLFAAGYEIDENFEGIIANTLGWENVALVHLNDSKCERNSRKDRHADVGEGFIGFSALMHVVEACVNREVPMILETPQEEKNGKQNTHKKQIKRIKKELVRRKII